MVFLNVPGGRYRVGTTAEGVETCVQEWKSRLIDPCYSEEKFKEWIEKEFPAHWISTQDFELQQCLVSNGDVREFIRETGVKTPESLTSGEPDNHPVWGVTLEWATAFSEWLSGKDEVYNFRLPLEQEWEVAARGEDFREYPYGDKFDSKKANTLESNLGRTTPVDHYRHHPGPFGHFDLAGNVEEWVSSKYNIYPGGRAVIDDLFERFGMEYSILRGGSFRCGGDLSRSARRHGPFPDPKFRYTGFRLVRSIK